MTDAIETLRASRTSKIHSRWSSPLLLLKLTLENRVALFARKTGREAIQFWTLVAFLTLAFLTGGGSRADIQSLIILRPLAVIVCGFALWNVRWEDLRANGFLVGMASAIFALVLLHLIPLPPALWGALPGREILVEIDRASGQGPLWRPLTLVPDGAWNAFYSLFVPLAVLLLGIQLSRQGRFDLLPVVLCLGLLSGLWGFLQAIGNPNGPLYLYHVTNNGTAVGLFSNRNHQAIFLATLFPMLSAFASVGARTEDQAKIRKWGAVAVGAALVPLLLVTGSRAGLLAGIIGLASAVLLYRAPDITVPKKRKVVKFNSQYALSALGVFVLAALTALLSRAEALQRLLTSDQTEDLRFRMWGPIAQMSWKYFPFGSGIGSFVEVYQLDEPNDLLSTVYINHAHNDWLEVFLTAGLPGLVILAIALIAIFRLAVVAMTAPSDGGRNAIFARLGAVIVAIFGIGSIGDYPLRSPSLACVFVVAVLWLAEVRNYERKPLAVSSNLV